MQQLEDYSVWGRERLFDEKGHFLATTDWEFYTPYVQFVLERLEVCQTEEQLDTDTFYRTLEDVKSNRILL